MPEVFLPPVGRLTPGIRTADWLGHPSPLDSTFHCSSWEVQLLTRELGDYGLGFALPSAGVFRFQHGGGNAGYRCGLVLSVESGDGVVIMTNSDSAEPLMGEVISAVAEAYGWRAE